jgi:hypothetical protein
MQRKYMERRSLGISSIFNVIWLFCKKEILILFTFEILANKRKDEVTVLATVVLSIDVIYRIS